MSKQAIVEVTKVELVEGEELQGLIKKVIDAVGRHKGKVSKSLGLTGIYKDHVIARDFETGRFFRMKMVREGADVVLSDAEEVRQVFVPARQKTEKGSGRVSEAEGHTHTAQWDDDSGDGETSEDEGHKHQIRNFRVLPPQPGGHTHDLPESASSKGKDKDKEKATKSEGTLVAVQGEVHSVELEEGAVAEVLKSLDSETPTYSKVEKASLWQGVLS